VTVADPSGLESALALSPDGDDTAGELVPAESGDVEEPLLAPVEAGLLPAPVPVPVGMTSGPVAFMLEQDSDAADRLALPGGAALFPGTTAPEVGGDDDPLGFSLLLPLFVAGTDKLGSGFGRPGESTVVTVEGTP
jgi:hypothetical protein